MVIYLLNLDWLDQAWRDWEHTRHDAAEGYHEWACFSAHTLDELRRLAAQPGFLRTAHRDLLPLAGDPAVWRRLAEMDDGSETKRNQQDPPFHWIGSRY